LENIDEVCNKETAAIFKPGYFLIVENPNDFE